MSAKTPSEETKAQTKASSSDMATDKRRVQQDDDASGEQCEAGSSSAAREDGKAPLFHFLLTIQFPSVRCVLPSVPLALSIRRCVCVCVCVCVPGAHTYTETRARDFPPGRREQPYAMRFSLHAHTFIQHFYPDEGT